MDAATAASRWPALPLLARHVGILIVCEVRLIRDGLVELLEAETAWSVVVRASGSDAALAHLERAPPPDIVLLDASMPQGLAIVHHFRGIDPQVRCVPFGIDDAPEAVSAWVEAGAAGFVQRSASRAELVGVLAGVLRSQRAGEDKAVANVFLPTAAASPPRMLPSSRPALTARERQILEQIYAGRSNKEIARCLKIEPATVKCHVHNLLAKLNVRRRAEAAVWLREHDGGQRLRVSLTA